MSIRSNVAAACLTAVLGAAHTFAAAQSAPSTRLPVDFYLGGVHLGSATFTSSGSGGRYQSRLDLETDGFVEWFFDAVLVARSAGAFDGRRLTPGSFDVDARSEEEGAFTIEMAFADGAPSRVVADPPYDPRPWEIDPTAQTGALDPLSAVLAGLVPNADGGACDRVIEIFDGRRRWDVEIGAEIRREAVDGGQRVDCSALYRRIGGFKPRFMEDPTIPFRIRFLERPDGTIDPVRAWSDTEFGTAVVVVDR